MELYLVLLFIAFILLAIRIRKEFSPRNQAIFQLAISVVFMIWMWLLDQSVNYSPKLVITSVVLFGAYRSIQFLRSANKSDATELNDNSSVI